MRRLRITGFILLASVLGCIASAQAQERPIRFIFPFTAGGSGDATARLIADKMRATLKASVIVENLTGGAGRIGVLAVRDLAPDGATLLLTPIAPVAVYQHSYKTLDYDPINDFQPVAQVATFDFGIAVGSKLSASSLAELATWCKANAEQANYGVPAIGTLPHFLGAMFARAAAIDLRPVPYRGSASALTDLIAGQIPIVVTTTSDLTEMHKAGRIRIVATSGKERSPFVSNVPTFRESGYDLVANGWYGVFAPAKTPANVVKRLNEAIVAAVRSPDVKEKLLGFGLEPTGTSAMEFAKIQLEDSRFWGAAVKASGFKAE